MFYWHHILKKSKGGIAPRIFQLATILGQAGSAGRPPLASKRALDANAWEIFVSLAAMLAREEWAGWAGRAGLA